MANGKLLDVSWATILKIGIAALGFYLLYLIRDIVLLVIFALVISVLLSPAISLLQRMRVSRILATSLVYVLIFSFVGFSVYLVSLVFISEVRQGIGDFSQLFEKFAPPLRLLGFEPFENVEAFLVSVEAWLKSASESIFSAIFAVLGGVFDGLLIFFLAFFFSLEEKWMEGIIKIFFPRKYENLALRVWEKSQQKIIGWFSSRVLASLFVGLATFVALKIFKVDYAVGLSLFAGITNIIPFLGPWLAGLMMAVLVALDDWLKALFVLGVFTIIQQVEGNILSPILTKKIIGLSPALVLVSLVVGWELFGFLGTILAIPLAGIIFDFLKEFLEKKKAKEATT